MLKKHIKNNLENTYIKMYCNYFKNNFFLILSNINGETIKYFSLGQLKTNNKKNTYTEQEIIRQTIKFLLYLGIKQINLFINGHKKKLISNLEYLITQLFKNNIRIVKIQNITAIPYNGTKQKKIRRV